MDFSFHGFVGNAVTLSLLKRALKNNTFKQVSIFSGPRGTGKSTSARAVAMSLVCESPVEGVACGKCSACRANAKALEAGTDSPWIKTVNLGRVSKLEEVNTLIKEVFEMQSTSQRQVFLFEELHALKGVKNGFTALLTEIDRISPNTYIVGTTTELRDVKEELRSRALQFEFRRLSSLESRTFIQKILAKKGYRISEEIESILVKQCKGIPREIEKLVEFIAENGVSLEEVQDYLQVVSDYIFAEIFFAAKDGEFGKVLELLENAESTASTAQIVERLKEFLVNVAFLLELKESDVFTEEEKAMVLGVFDSAVLYKVVSIVEKLNKGSSRNDLILALVKVGTIVAGQKESAIVVDRKIDAAKEKAGVLPKIQQKTEGNLTPLSLKSLRG